MARRPKLRTILASNIRASLARRSTSAAAVAGLAGVSVAHLYDVLNAKKAATIDFVEKVAAELDVEPWELLRESKE